jgi:hypothetical protein
MRTARVLKFAPADRVGSTAGGFDLLVSVVEREPLTRLARSRLFGCYLIVSLADYLHKAAREKDRIKNM